MDFFEGLRPDFWKQLDDWTWSVGDETFEDQAAVLSELRCLCVLWWAMFNMGHDHHHTRRDREKSPSDGIIWSGRSEASLR